LHGKKLTLFQAGFTEGGRVGNIFLINVCVDKYLRAKRSRLFWCFVDVERCFVDFKKASDTISREAL
jgi:hypothetical protein